jgi:Dehydrogenases with different specificities (related to short-chain alcohol dehydrogenases)
MSFLADKVAYVTGAAMGNGKGIAAVLAKYGARVILADVSDLVFETARDLTERGFEAAAFKVDVTNIDEVRQSVDEVLSKYGKIDILINNAGVCRLANFMEMDDELRDYHFDINIKGVWNCTKAIIPAMVSQKYGKIVVLSSVTGPMVADEGETAYATTKAALWGFTKALAREFASCNINVNSICPGYIMTPMAQSIAEQSDEKSPDNVLNAIAGGVPLGRLGTIEEIGELAAFLASD